MLSAGTTKRKRSIQPRTLIICASIGASVVALLGMLFVMDKSLSANTAAKRDLAAKNTISTNRSGNNQIEAMFLSTNTPGSSSALPNGINADALRNGQISASTARAALRNSSAESIQKAVQTKTGKNVSVSNIERARSSALSSKGQKKINEALKRRDEVDISTIREKFKRF